MHPFFEQNPFQADASSDLENEAKLALHLVLYLLSTHNLDDGAWPGAHVAARLRHTCHALEALHLLGLEATSEAIESGLAWLVNLSNTVNSDSGDEDWIRLYPSRFKTLAWLGAFNAPRLITDFEDLEEHFDEDGLLRGIMANQLLGTIVYVDCLDYLEKLQPLPVLSLERREQALKCIEQNVLLWHQDLKQNTQSSRITTVGTLSYAVDLLFRAGRLSNQVQISRDALSEMISELRRSQDAHPMNSDTLYCAIQLSAHFNEFVEANDAVQELIRHLSTRYEKLDLRREPSFFHPLVLRLLLAHGGKPLRAEMTRILLKHEQQSLEVRRQSREQSLKDDFRILIKNRFDVEIAEIQRLTGGITSAEIFRVHFSLKLSSIDSGQKVQVTSPGSLVVKSGSFDSLIRSIARYQSLPNKLKPYFAKHAGEPHILQVSSDARSYLIMEDLTEMSTFRDVIIRLDRGVLSKTHREDLRRAAHVICTNLFEIYDNTRRGDTDFFGPQFSRLYISNVERSLIQMCGPDKFPHLKSWFRGFKLGERKFLSIEHYLRKLERHRAKLKVPYLMLIHGDCHSRNIMLDDKLNRMRLIDLDHLDNDGDYITDLARLIEDISIFGFLIDDDYRHHVHQSQITFPSDTGERNVIENRIEYPAFSSEAVRLFQHHVLENLQTYAKRNDDDTWRQRLWLALATNLMLLVDKQADQRYATVVYVEAVKLLDELVSCLDKGFSLGDVPFPGIHPAGVRPESGTYTASRPAWSREDSVLTRLHDDILALDLNIDCKLAASGRVAQYYASNSQQPFAIIDGKKHPPSILLACSADDLKDHSGMAEARETGSGLKTILRLANEGQTGPLLDLVRQAYELNL